MGMEDGLDDALNIAGYWTLGVGKGFLVPIVPVAVVGLAWGASTLVIDKGIGYWKRRGGN